jgi:hypothetical protein
MTMIAADTPPTTSHTVETMKATMITKMILPMVFMVSDIRKRIDPSWRTCATRRQIATCRILRDLLTSRCLAQAISSVYAAEGQNEKVAALLTRARGIRSHPSGD